jgi:hypothetical protein
MQRLARDLTVSLGPDRPGALARATDAIAKAGVNLDGYMETKGILHALAADAPRARRALEEAGFEVTDEQDVVVIDVEDRPGMAADVFRRVADADVNVAFSYLGANNRMVIGAPNVQRLAEIFSMESAGAARR